MATQGPGTVQSYQAIYRACMKEAAAQGRPLMQRLVARGVETLQRQSLTSPDDIERRVLGDAVLTDVYALVSSVLGLKTVFYERNLLLLEVYVRSLRTVTLQSPIP